MRCSRNWSVGGGLVVFKTSELKFAITFAGPERCSGDASGALLRRSDLDRAIEGARPPLAPFFVLWAAFFARVGASLQSLQPSPRAAIGGCGRLGTAAS